MILAWLAYTALNTVYPGDALTSLLAFIPGVVGIAALLAAGLTLEECYLRAAPVSRGGIAAFAAMTALFIPSMLFTGRWAGWNWLAALVYAPASGIAQELFFRAALLPALLWAFRTSKHQTALALFATTGLFVVWHLRTFILAPIGGDIGTLVFTSLGGIVWGWQVQRDRTVLWAMAFHTGLLMITSLFAWA